MSPSRVRKHTPRVYQLIFAKGVLLRFCFTFFTRFPDPFLNLRVVIKSILTRTRTRSIAVRIGYRN